VHSYTIYRLITLTTEYDFIMMFNSKYQSLLLLFANCHLIGYISSITVIPLRANSFFNSYISCSFIVYQSYCTSTKLAITSCYDVCTCYSVKDIDTNFNIVYLASIALFHSVSVSLTSFVSLYIAIH
jgi:hypothetical protein